MADTTSGKVTTSVAATAGLLHTYNMLSRTTTLPGCLKMLFALSSLRTIGCGLIVSWAAFTAGQNILNKKSYPLAAACVIGGAGAGLLTRMFAIQAGRSYHYWQMTRKKGDEQVLKEMRDHAAPSLRLIEAAKERKKKQQNDKVT